MNNDQSLQEKITALEELGESFEMFLTGYEKDSRGVWKYNGKPQTGEELAKQITSLLGPFIKRINLISSKKRESFIDQRYYVIKSFLSIITNSLECPPRNRQAIIENFFETVINIGDVILESKKSITDMWKFNRDESRGYQEVLE